MNTPHHDTSIWTSTAHGQLRIALGFASSPFSSSPRAPGRFHHAPKPGIDIPAKRISTPVLPNRTTSSVKRRMSGSSFLHASSRSLVWWSVTISAPLSFTTDSSNNATKLLPSSCLRPETQCNSLRPQDFTPQFCEHWTSHYSTCSSPQSQMAEEIEVEPHVVRLTDSISTLERDLPLSVPPLTHEKQKPQYDESPENSGWSQWQSKRNARDISQMTKPR